MPAVHIATPDGQRAVYDENEAREKVASGNLPPESVFWLEGMAAWKPVSEMGETLGNYRPPVSGVVSDAPAMDGFSGAPRTSGLAIASMVFGVLSVFLSIVAGLPAIICGHTALREIKKSGSAIRGRGLAIVGLFFGYFFTLTFVVVVVPMISNPHPESFRLVDASSLRQIGQASLIFAHDNEKKLPSATIIENGVERPATIHDAAMMLALEGGLNDASIWFSRADDALSGAEQELTTVLIPLGAEQRAVHPDFGAQQVFSFDYVTGLSTDLPSTTPVAWTRGLRLDGTWDRDGVYSREGGYIVFLAGNVSSYRDLGSGSETGRLVGRDGERTSNILDALPSGARIVGGGPASLDGTVVP